MTFGSRISGKLPARSAASSKPETGNPPPVTALGSHAARFNRPLLSSVRGGRVVGRAETS
tara:strand:- start:1006 stop:1185 length:180 start_codon:yes stop_codon:yes gene_type:complete